ncbi:MAG: PepSY domain-containing protein [Phenylobacterium sp.]
MVIHRYLGVAMGVPMLLWCLSGAVMLFVHYPSLSQDERLAQSPRIDWSNCCRMADAAPPDARIDSAAIEQLAASPVLRLRIEGGDRRMVDLATGAPLGQVSPTQAAAVATGWGRVGDITPVASDQWTVSGEFNRVRPFWRVRLVDGARTDLYVSQVTGEVAQRTTARSRALNWLGAVPHWLYPSLLRRNTALWTQVVIWTSLAGLFLTVAGLYLGVLAWGRSRDGRVSPFRGLMTWHHLSGLTAGLLTLAWVASGLFSMNPLGFLESPGDNARQRIAGTPATFSQVQAALEAVAAAAPAAAQARIAPLDGRIFVMSGNARYDALGRRVPMTPADLTLAGRRLGPVAGQALLASEDSYYFSHHERVTLPVWRVLLRDGRRLYLDPQSGALLADVDAPARGYRWLHQGLHRLDFVPGYRQGALWAAIVLILLSAASLGVGTGVWLAWRRLVLDVASLRGQRAGRARP